MKNLVLFLFSLILITNVFAQETQSDSIPQMEKVGDDQNSDSKDKKQEKEPVKVVEGQVFTVKDSVPLEGADVYLRGKPKSEVTDEFGFYELKVYKNKDTVMVVSFPGLASKEINLRNVGDLLNVYLKPPKEDIPVGYGFKKEKDLVSSSVPKTPTKALENSIPYGFQANMQGRAPGVHVTKSSGNIASANDVNIRGINSIIGSGSPLYVMDGMPIISGTQGDGSGSIGKTYGYQNDPLYNLNPDFIESVHYLKDVGTAGIYGGRGSNGVVYIKTKTGNPGKTHIDFDYSTGIAMPTNTIEMLNGPQYRETVEKAYKNTTGKDAGNKNIYVDDNFLNGDSIYGFSSELARRTNNNYLDKLMRTGQMNRAQLSATGGNKKVNFFVGTNYNKIEGILINSDFERFSGRFNINSHATENLTLGFRAEMDFTKSNLVPSGQYNQGGFGMAQTKSLPIFPVQFSEDNFNKNAPTTFNEFFNAFNGTNIDLLHNRTIGVDQVPHHWRERQVYRNVGNVFAEYEFIEGLKAKSLFGVDYYNNTDRTYRSRFTRRIKVEDPQSFDESGEAQDSLLESTAMASDFRSTYFLISNINTLRYAFEIGDKHDFKAMIGHSYQNVTNRNNGVTAQRFSGDYTQLVSGANVFNRNKQIGTENGFAFVSYFSRINYNMSKKYYAIFNLRFDQSSRYGEDITAVPFPSLKLGWDATKESFFPESSFINYLKVRGGFGLVGNSKFDNLQPRGFWKGGQSDINNQNLKGRYPFTLASRQLKPEIFKQTDIGIDYGLLDNRLSGTISFYNKRSDNSLLPYPATPSMGVESPVFVKNGVSIRSRGLEFYINSINVDSKFTWTTNLNLTTNSSKMVSLDGLKPEQAPQLQDVRLFEGEDIGTFYLPRYAGTNSKGEEMILDQNGNKFRPSDVEEINNARVNTGKSYQPDFFGGIGNTFSYKGISLDAFFTFSYGNYILDQGERIQSYVNGENNLRKSLVDGDHPKLYYTNAPGTSFQDPLSKVNTTRFLHDASYLRLKSLRLSYRIPRTISNKLFLYNAKIYFRAQNLLTFTKFPGWDPEVSGNTNTPLQRSIGRGITTFNVPQLRTLVMGFKVGI